MIDTQFKTSKQENKSRPKSNENMPREYDDSLNESLIESLADIPSLMVLYHLKC